jgi:acid stress chaperone HdeB
MHKLVVVATLLASAFLTTAAGAANRLDLNTVKCGEWLESGQENIGATMAWLDGYYTGEDDPPVIDFDKMGAKAKKLGKYCAENKDLSLGTAAEKALGAKK